MRLKLSDLQRVVESTVQEKQVVETFCNEIKRVFGPTVDVSNKLDVLAERANDRLDVLDRTGRTNYIKFSSKIALSLSTHPNPEVRRLIARLLPESSAVSFINDKHASVRKEAAKKAPLKMVEAAVRKYKNDHLLQEVLEEKLLSEERESALVAAASGPAGEEFFSDRWYDSMARKIIQDYYMKGLDTGWVSSAVKQAVLANRASNRHNIDPHKLMKAVVEMIADEEDAKAEKLGLNESADNSSKFILENDLQDPVQHLIDASTSSSEYINKANQIFNVKFSIVPPGIKKYNIGEGRASSVNIPVVAFLPHKSSPRYVDEIALDTYVKHWSSQQQLRGEPYKLSWSSHPDSQNKISFRLELK